MWTCVVSRLVGLNKFRIVSRIDIDLVRATNWVGIKNKKATSNKEWPWGSSCIIRWWKRDKTNVNKNKFQLRYIFIKQSSHFIIAISKQALSNSIVNSSALYVYQFNQ